MNAARKSSVVRLLLACKLSAVCLLIACKSSTVRLLITFKSSAAPPHSEYLVWILSKILPKYNFRKTVALGAPVMKGVKACKQGGGQLSDSCDRYGTKTYQSRTCNGRGVMKSLGAHGSRRCRRASAFSGTLRGAATIAAAPTLCVIARCCLRKIAR